MANQEHVDLLRDNVRKWNTWRKEHPGIVPDFSGANLSFTFLNGANLTDANLTDANFSFTFLMNANFSGADLSGVKLIGAIIGHANFSGANLSHANFSRADLGNTDLSRAILSRLDLSFADLNHADLSFANLTDANLSFANLHLTNLSGANLSSANLIGANFSFAKLSFANLSSAIVHSTTFGGLDLRTVQGLETVEHSGPSHVSIDTIFLSQGQIPEVFLRGTGAPESFIEYMHSLVALPIQYYTCFISYSHHDEAFGKRLHNDLQSEGVRCWFAPEDMDIGDKIRYRIDESIRMYDKLLLILSEHSIASSWVAYEVERALNKEPAGVPNVLYPVRLDETILTCEQQWAKDIQQTRHIGNFEGWKTNHDAYQESFKLLLRALKPKDATKNKAGR